MQKPPVKGETPLRSTPRMEIKCSGALNKRARGDMEKDMTLATTYSSNGLPRKYHRRIGLNFRVRNGNGCFPDAMTTRVMSQMKTRRKCRCLHPQNCTSQLRPRPISTGQLNTLLCLHLQPINLVVYQGSTSSCDDERSRLRVGFALICLQHLSNVDIATQLRAPGGTTGTPAVDYPGSSRTTGKSRQISNTCGG